MSEPRHTGGDPGESYLVLLNSSKAQRQDLAVVNPCHVPSACQSTVLHAYRESCVLHVLMQKLNKPLGNTDYKLHFDTYWLQVATEGDAFTMAFHDASDAIAWALEVQHKLLTLPWPDRLLSQPDAGLLYSPDPAHKDLLLFKGLRVRMAMHTGCPEAIQVRSTMAEHFYVRHTMAEHFDVRCTMAEHFDVRCTIAEHFDVRCTIAELLMSGVPWQSILMSGAPWQSILMCR